jgi:hypothetical protein
MESSGTAGRASEAGLGTRTHVRGGVNPLIRELSIAQAIVDVATRYAAGRTVSAIELRVGREREVASE